MTFDSAAAHFDRLRTQGASGLLVPEADARSGLVVVLGPSKQSSFMTALREGTQPGLCEDTSIDLAHITEWFSRYAAKALMHRVVQPQYDRDCSSLAAHLERYDLAEAQLIVLSLPADRRLLEAVVRMPRRGPVVLRTRGDLWGAASRQVRQYLSVLPRDAVEHALLSSRFNARTLYPDAISDVTGVHTGVGAVIGRSGPIGPRATNDETPTRLRLLHGAYLSLRFARDDSARPQRRVIDVRLSPNNPHQIALARLLDSAALTSNLARAWGRATIDLSSLGPREFPGEVEVTSLLRRDLLRHDGAVAVSAWDPASDWIEAISLSVGIPVLRVEPDGPVTEVSDRVGGTAPVAYEAALARTLRSPPGTRTVFEARRLEADREMARLLETVVHRDRGAS